MTCSIGAELICLPCDDAAHHAFWCQHKTADAGEVESFTIITQPAGPPLNSYHDRAPVVLHQADWSTWLDLSADVRPLLGPESVDGFNIAQA